MWLTEARLRLARARIADAVIGAMPPGRLGEISLRNEQRHSAARVADLIDRYGGALLADEVGRGKTYVALAIARQWERPLVVAPASLRTTWEDAMRRAGVPCAFVSHESLSAGRRPAIAPDGIVVDESHRFRSAVARRHAMLTEIAARVPVLLMSATPLQNRARDLAAQLAVFLGMRAFALAPDALTRFVVRTPMADPTFLPVVAAPRWIPVDVDDGAVLRAILDLPPPPRALDAGDAGVLRALTLVRAWASSRAALRSMLDRRRAAATAIEQSAAEGLWPTRRQLQSWHADERATQLGFASMLADASARDSTREALRSAAAADLAALDRIEREMRTRDDPDVRRVVALEALRASLADARILAISEFASTVRAYWSALRGKPAVGMLTSNDARIASGRLPRDELLAMFAPCARGLPRPRERETVTLLLATDLLSEGVNLQDASVVVHLDLPWNPARLEQRVGRVRRPGGAASVQAYLMSAPASTELLLGVERRLRRKLATAERTIGRAMPVVPPLSPRFDRDSAVSRDPVIASAEAIGELHARIAGWSVEPRATKTPGRGRRPIVAAVNSPIAGWLAALDGGRLVAAVGTTISDDDSVAIEAARFVEGAARPLRAGELTTARRALDRWLDAEQLEADCGLDATGDDVARRCERALSVALSRAPRYQRAPILALAERVRSLLLMPRSLGVERALLAHLAAFDDESDVVAWLERTVALLATPGTRKPTVGGLVAMVLFGPSVAAP